jgi:hypothetical protein
MAEEDPPFSLTIKMDLAVIPEGEATEEQKGIPNAAKIIIGGQEYYMLMGRLRVEPIEE